MRGVAPALWDMLKDPKAPTAVAENVYAALSEIYFGQGLTYVNGQPNLPASAKQVVPTAKSLAATGPANQRLVASPCSSAPPETTPRKSPGRSSTRPTPARASAPPPWSSPSSAPTKNPPPPKPSSPRRSPVQTYRRHLPRLRPLRASASLVTAWTWNSAAQTTSTPSPPASPSTSPSHPASYPNRSSRCSRTPIRKSRPTPATSSASSSTPKASNPCSPSGVANPQTLTRANSFTAHQRPRRRRPHPIPRRNLPHLPQRPLLGNPRLLLDHPIHAGPRNSQAPKTSP